MAIDDLLSKEKNIRTKHRNNIKKYEILKSLIEQEIHAEFGRFLDDNLSHLSDDKKITGWKVDYDAVIDYYRNDQEIKILITHIGNNELNCIEGSPLYGLAKPEVITTDLPDHLKIVQQFGRNYSVKVTVEQPNEDAFVMPFDPFY